MRLFSLGTNDRTLHSQKEKTMLDCMGSFALQEQRQRVSNFILAGFVGKAKGNSRVGAGNARLLKPEYKVPGNSSDVATQSHLEVLETIDLQSKNCSPPLPVGTMLLQCCNEYLQHTNL